ncbi:hypothetical protein [Halobacillus sp. Marseille-Q1614]|uniref:hypothetical protein n=1 Tax=Halobacillus sp. Marseille-Q1614 TaxID=2709134 RepID=UPI00156F50F1|nr:hypothetical protein [Halobacillus sp. Marseille-Q1614]
MDQNIKLTYIESLHLLSSMQLTKKSMAAYQHAKETIDQGSPIEEEICQACADVCRQCAKALRNMKTEGIEEMVSICIAHAIMCEDLCKARV